MQFDPDFVGPRPLSFLAGGGQMRALIRASDWSATPLGVPRAMARGDQRVDLLFSGVVLRGRSGKAIAEQAIALRPDLKVLFTTGYSRNAIVHHGRLDPGVQLIAKPFTFEQHATRVRKLLDRP